jgi:hypothetical protein
MARQQDRRADLLDRAADVGVVLGDVPAEVRVLAGAHRAAVLPEVERVERIALRGEPLREVSPSRDFSARTIRSDDGALPRPTARLRSQRS